MGARADSIAEQARAAVLIVHEPGLDRAWIDPALERLRRAGFVAAEHELSVGALESDRRAIPELDRALEALRNREGVDAERLGVLGFGRGGTLAFLLGCTRRLAALIDVEGRVLYPVLSSERPIQPLELALNLEGAFLGVFAEKGAVGAEERELLRERLASAARPFELAVLSEAGEDFFHSRRAGYDGARTEELWRLALAFLVEHLGAEDDLGSRPER